MALVGATNRVDFVPRLPCVFDDRLTVDAVFVDELPGSKPEPRVNFVVARRGEHAFVLSETRALEPFTQIPQGTDWLRLTAQGVTATGFAGPSGTGVDIAYLRWRRDDVTYALAASLRSWLSRRDVEDLAVALIERQ